LKFFIAKIHSDHIIINVMTTAEGAEGERYVDTNTVLYDIYPFHTTEDMDEQIISVSFAKFHFVLSLIH
jgi:hypothetical protein